MATTTFADIKSADTIQFSNSTSTSTTWVLGDAHSDSFNVTGNANFDGNIKIIGDLNVMGTLTTGGDLNVLGTITAGGFSTFRTGANQVFDWKVTFGEEPEIEKFLELFRNLPDMRK